MPPFLLPHEALTRYHELRASAFLEPCYVQSVDQPPLRPTVFRVPLHEIEFTYVRSSGPGGQNVNKVNSKAVARWNVLRSSSLGEDQRVRLLSRLGRRLTREGDILLASDRFRDQARNRNDCVEKLARLISEALAEAKERHATKATRASRRRRRETKTRSSLKKKLRERVR